MSESITQREIRKLLLAKGYQPIPLVGKRALIKGWTRATVDEGWLAEHVGRSRRFTNTGIRGDSLGGLAPFDLDTMDGELGDRLEAAIEAVCGPTPLCRWGRTPRRLLLYRCPGIEQSSRTARYGDHMVELLGGSGRQFVAFGPYPGEDYDYAWDTVSPLDEDPPAITLDQADEAMAACERILEESGYERTSQGLSRGADADTLPVLTGDYELCLAASGEIVLWRDLKGDVPEGGLWANVRRENGEFGDSDGVHCIRTPSGQVLAYDFPRDCLLVEPSGLPELADALPTAHEQEPLFGESKLIEMLDDCVYIASEDVVGSIAAPWRQVRLAHWKTSMRPYVIETEVNGKTKRVKCADAWLDHPKRLTADIQAMRPDMADDPLPIVRGARVFNTYRRPVHPAAGDGEIGTVVEFLDHLLPRPSERELFLDWHALKMLHPSWRMHALLMVTESFGTGRGTWCEDILPKLLGGYVKDVPLSQLIGKTYQSQYNDYLSGSLVITVREALELDERSSFFRARRAAYEHLKQVVDPAGGREQHIVRKGTANTSETLFASVLISSNHVDALAIPPEDRRVIVLDNAKRPLPADLAERIHRWHQVPANIAALYHWLMLRAENVQTYVDPFGTPPATPARERMITAGETDADRLWSAVVDQAPGALITWAQFHARAYRLVQQSGGELEMPDSGHLRAMLQGRPKANEGRQIRIGGRDGAVVRAYILRDRVTWESAQISAIKEELQKNGEPGSTITRLPGS
jgi:hypothetical protein